MKLALIVIAGFAAAAMGATLQEPEVSTEAMHATVLEPRIVTPVDQSVTPVEATATPPAQVVQAEDWEDAYYSSYEDFDFGEFGSLGGLISATVRALTDYILSLFNWTSEVPMEAAISSPSDGSLTVIQGRPGVNGYNYTKTVIPAATLAKNPSVSTGGLHIRKSSYGTSFVNIGHGNQVVVSSW